jgi:hypothetical protein
MIKGLPVVCWFFILLLAAACEPLDTVNKNDPDRTDIVAAGGDLLAVLHSGYAAWWRGVHEDHPVIALSVAADAYGMAWRDWGANRMGKEPRTAYNNRSAEEVDYKEIAEAPWFGCLSAVSSANDVLLALEDGVSVDNGGPQDRTIRAAAHLLRGLAWGYLGLIFDQAILAEDLIDPTQPLVFTPYPGMIDAAVTELDTAIGIARTAGGDFTHSFFQGLTLRDSAFIELCHSYAARFLTQWPRTATEAGQVDWQAVLDYAEQGLSYDFAPLADGNLWMSYQKHVFAETGQGPFWARVDQRLIAAMDPSQPTRYPEVVAEGEAPLTNPQATSKDQRLQTDFLYLETVNFPADLGEWHRSHYKHNRNQSDPSFAGDGSTGGPMPVFLAADNQLLRAEALLRLNRKSEAIKLINTGTRVQRGQLPPLSEGATPAEVERAIIYERAIELLSTAPMGLWFDRRRTAPRLNYRDVDDLGGLQTGTPAQLPVPADELNIQSMEPYNFGGPNDPEGIEPVF